MERLTNKREADAQREEYERRLANGYPRNIPEERFLRLAAYEDTELYPENVEALKLSMMGKAISEITEFDGLPIDRLRELAEADKDGRVVVLPCKVGDVLYAAESPPVIPLHVMEVAIYLALQGEDGGDYERISNIGKTVFLTREEAEKAMEVSE